jgi:hydrogenase maturation protease
MGDDGLGVRAIERLALASPTTGPDVRILDGGTLGLSLLPTLEDAEAVVLVDAIRTGDSPGTVVQLEADEVPANVDVVMSPHELGVVDLLRGSMLAGRRPPRLVLLGIVPADISFGVELSPEVEAAMPALLAAIVRVASDWGHELPRAA